MANHWRPTTIKRQTRTPCAITRKQSSEEWPYLRAVQPPCLRAVTSGYVDLKGDRIKEDAVIILGIVLLIVGFLTGISILWTIGIILVVVGVILFALGAAGHAVGGRRHYY
ncbi:MAG: hypothetical protein K0Q61_3268 [Rhodococcus erythropolis]|nr:hypothetical protein [Rhodococcus erythropolis]